MPASARSGSSRSFSSRSFGVFSVRSSPVSAAEPGEEDMAPSGAAGAEGQVEALAAGTSPSPSPSPPPSPSSAAPAGAGERDGAASEEEEVPPEVAIRSTTPPPTLAPTAATVASSTTGDGSAFDGDDRLTANEVRGVARFHRAWPGVCVCVSQSVSMINLFAEVLLSANPPSVSAHHHSPRAARR